MHWTQEKVDTCVCLENGGHLCEFQGWWRGPDNLGG